MISPIQFLLTLTLVTSSLFSFSQFNEWETYKILEDFESHRGLIYKTNSPKIPFGPVSNPNASGINRSNYVGKVIYKINDNNKNNPHVKTYFNFKLKCNNRGALTCPINFRDNPKFSIDIYTDHHTLVFVQYIDEGLAEQMGNDGQIKQLVRWVGAQINENTPPKWEKIIFDFSEFSFYEPIGFTKVQVVFTHDINYWKKGIIDRGKKQHSEVYYDNIRQFNTK